MKRLIRRWLGLDAIADNAVRHAADLHKDIYNLRVEHQAFTNMAIPILSDISTVLSSENSDARKALSDEIGKRAVKQMKDEDWARKHTTGEA